MKILANDGLDNSGIEIFKSRGFEIITNTVNQGDLIDYINSNGISAILVRSATQVRKDIIDGCKGLKVIGRGGVGMDNIDVAYAQEKGLKVINTPDASSHSVAELVFAHLYGLVRFLPDSNRLMPLEGDSSFKDLKKKYAKGIELKGKKLGIIGLGRIGKAVAEIGIRMGMEVIGHDPFLNKAEIAFTIANTQIKTVIKSISMQEVLERSDFITLHIPSQKEYIIGEKELGLMKNSSFLINASRGGLIDEKALEVALKDKKIAGAALDVFEEEPNPKIQLLMNEKLSLTPHTGASTIEAQIRIGTELANKVIEALQ